MPAPGTPSFPARRACVVAGGALLLTPFPLFAAQEETVEPARLLRQADLSRGGGMPGLVWEVHLVSMGAGAPEQRMHLRIKAAGNASVAETLAPLRSKGGKMLQIERAMWLTKPGLKKPIPISPRQRLSGQAAIGDIAATNYARDYTATLLREEPVSDEPCHVLELKSLNQQTTYDRLLYWISKERGVGIRAAFFSLSGKQLKHAEFDYDNTVRYEDRTIPFISRMTIFDSLTDSHTRLDYSEVVVRRLPPSEFHVGHLE